jgi:hypothetical protein
MKTVIISQKYGRKNVNCLNFLRMRFIIVFVNKVRNIALTH